MADLEKAVSNYQFALRQPNSLTITRITASRGALTSCAVIKHWEQAYNVSEIAVDLIPKLTFRSLENSDKQHMLGQVASLASDAAAVALYAKKGSLVALNFLEQGRGVLAASLEDLRTDILDLQERHPELAEEFSNLRDELEAPVTRNMSFTGETQGSITQTQINRRYEAGSKFNDLIIEIRKQSGFEDFLLAPKEREMQDAASCGPIVVINVSKHRCDAILVEPHRIRTLNLPNLNVKDINQKARAGNLENLKVLEWLWEVVTNPILIALGFTQPPRDNNWPHVWWIPTGALSKFPLHAAGHHAKGSSEAVLNRVMSSYSSSIKIVINSRRRRDEQPASAQALLVAIKYQGKLELPSAAKEIETVSSLCNTMSINHIEPGRRKQDITSHLPQCKIFHFAGHGYTDDDDPSKSHLLLGGGENEPLTVADLLSTNIRKSSPFLAYLSACGTGQIKDERSFDENIHLISACQLAGFRHVIGTLWEVNDELCIDMARITYEGMRDGGMTDESVCRGLHDATRRLRDHWLNMPTKVRRGRNSVRKVDLSLVENKTKVRSTTDGDQRMDRLPRDASMSSGEEHEEAGSLHYVPLHWVPYVHFGV
ncbi:hypothetical protein MMC10_000744 [Thelotrema lepadinum]|nr:hypothetical protein [Thelotrema lepadinum]